MTRLVKIAKNVSQYETEDWWRSVQWQTRFGDVDLWRRRSSPMAGPVRVSGAVPGAVFALQPSGPPSSLADQRTEAEQALITGLAAEVEDHRVVFRMPERGWRRDRRRVFIDIDGEEYVARPRGVAASDLRRPDGVPIWRKGFMREYLADDATPIEVTVAALCTVVELHERMVRNPIRLI